MCGEVTSSFAIVVVVVVLLLLLLLLLFPSQTALPKQDVPLGRLGERHHGHEMGRFSAALVSVSG